MLDFDRKTLAVTESVFDDNKQQSFQIQLIQLKSRLVVSFYCVHSNNAVKRAAFFLSLASLSKPARRTQLRHHSRQAECYVHLLHAG